MEGLIASHELTFYLVAGLAILVVGLAKGGFIGMGALAMPIMTLVMDPIRAAAILLPILIVQDWIGFVSFRKTWDANLLKVMLPGAIIGIFLGWLFASSVSVKGVEGLIGVIAVAFGGNQLLGTNGFGVKLQENLPKWIGTFCGAVAGFTSQIAHSGGPPFQVWALTRGLSRDVYAGTSILFFAVVNLTKVPAYFALGQFSRENMIMTVVFLPLAILSTLLGVALVRQIDPKRFFTLVHVLLFLVGIELLHRAWY